MQRCSATRYFSLDPGLGVSGRTQRALWKCGFTSLRRASASCPSNVFTTMFPPRPNNPWESFKFPTAIETARCASSMAFCASTSRMPVVGGAMSESTTCIGIHAWPLSSLSSQECMASCSIARSTCFAFMWRTCTLLSTCAFGMGKDLWSTPTTLACGWSFQFPTSVHAAWSQPPGADPRSSTLPPNGMTWCASWIWNSL